MPEWLAIALALLGGAATICSIILSSRNIKKTGPGEQVRSRLSEVDTKLDNDNRRINYLERGFERVEEFDRLLLRSVKAILGHLSEGNHTATMKEEIRVIDEYLISR